MVRARRPRGGDERGAAAVEFAIVASLLFLLVFGIIAFGLFFSRYQVYQGAAREAARLAAVRADNTEVKNRAYDAASPYDDEMPTADQISISIGDPGAAVADPGPACTDATRGERVTVSWVQPFDIVLPLVPALTFDVTIRGVFRCE